MTDPASQHDPLHIRRAQRRGVSRFSQPMFIGAGLLTGTLALFTAGWLAFVVFSLVLTVVSVMALVTLIVAFWFFWPALVHALKIGRIKTQDSITRANPLEALHLQRDQFSQRIAAAREQLATASGELVNMERQFQDHRAHLTLERVATWQAQMDARRAAYQQAEDRLKEMGVQLGSFDRQLDTARAEMGMAQADSALGKALSASVGTPPDLSRTSKVAFESIRREIGRSSALLDLTLKEI